MTDENCEIPIVPPTITATETSHETKGNTVPIITVKGSSEMWLQMDDVLGLPAVTSTENNSHESPNKEPVIAGFIPKVNYLIDYIEGAPSTILKTIQGHEPEPQVQKDFKDTHAIEVRRKIRVNTTKFSTQYLTQPMEIVINSPHLVDALRAVVTYYPMSIDSAPQTFRHPYHPLIHHIEELRTFGRDHPNNEHLDDTILHINLLLEVLAKDVLATLESEKKLHAYPTPTTTFENLWCIFKPGKDVYINDAVSGACVIKAVQRLSSNVRPPDSYFIECWRLRFDGSHYTPESHTFIIPSFKGERAITTLPVYPKEFCPKPSPGELPLDQQLVDRGRAIHELHQNSPAHREYNGLTLPGLGPCQEIQGRVVVDYESFRAHKVVNEKPRTRVKPVHNQGGLKYPPPRSGGPERQWYRVIHDDNHDGDDDDDDDDDYYDDYGYVYMVESQTAPKFESASTTNGNLMAFSEYQKIPVMQTLTDHQLSLLCGSVPGWILTDRKWAILDINCISEISPDKKIFDSLILPDGHTEIIKALVASHVQVQKKGDTDDGAGATISKHRTYIPYAADSIRGKGQGLLVLLHGAPGVGKTSTAECVAEYTEKPLYPITCGDIGTDPATLEHRLQWQFYLAQRWGAVLLLDEADIFLQARDISDLNRNSLVSVFLRVLEYYTGILFLTSNRVGTFDEAFTSRLHVVLYYPPLDSKKRTQIWKNHVSRLERLRPEINVKEAVHEYLESSELQKAEFNGRQIRNIFQTAVSLALYEAASDEDRANRDPVLHSRHLKKVVGLSSAFQMYLEQTRDKDSRNAKDDELRNDSFTGSSRRR